MTAFTMVRPKFRPGFDVVDAGVPPIRFNTAPGFIPVAGLFIRWDGFIAADTTFFPGARIGAPGVVKAIDDRVRIGDLLSFVY